MKFKLKKKKLGRPFSITPQFHCASIRSIVRAPGEHVTTYTIVSIYRTNVGIRRVQQLMQQAANLKWTRIVSAPRLTEDHGEARVERTK